MKSSDPICRWVFEGIIIDIMPTDEAILGFGNRWYTSALTTATQTLIADDLEIQVISAPYFLATKIEAFRGRGNGDFLYSRDIADIVAIIDGRSELVAEVRAANQELQSFLAVTFQQYLADDNFLDALSGHLLPDAASQSRVSLLIERINRIIEISL